MPAPIRTVGTRPNLFLGGDREVVLGSILVAGMTAFALNPWFFACGVLFSAAVIGLANVLAQRDPLYVRIYLRAARRYKRHYPARPTPYAPPPKRREVEP